MSELHEGFEPLTPGRSKPEHDRSIEAGLVAIAVIWGLNFVVVKVVLREIEPLAFNALRFPLACLVLWGVMRRRAGPMLPERSDWSALILLGIIGNVAYQPLFIYGLDLTLAGNASLLLATTPAWTLMLSTVLGHDKLSFGLLIGVSGTLGGMVLVVLGGDREMGFGDSSLLGDLLMVSASIAWTIYTVGSRRLVGKYGALPVTAWTLWIGTIGIVLMGLRDSVTMSWREVSLGAWLGLVYAGVFAIAVAYSLWYRGVERIGNTRTAVFANLVPVVALITAWLWLGEVPTLLQLTGAGVIVVGLYLARRSGSPRLILQVEE